MGWFILGFILICIIGMFETPYVPKRTKEEEYEYQRDLFINGKRDK